MAGVPAAGLDFVAIDFETANRTSASACQVGVAVVRDGTVVAADGWFIVPPTGLDAFDAWNIRIHGITPDAIVRGGGLSWADSVERLMGIAGGLSFVAHNAPFDRGVMAAACGLTGVPMPANDWRDTVPLARRHLPGLPNHKLPTVSEHLGAAPFAHHDAAADALACAQIAVEVARRAGLHTVADLWPQPAPGASRPGWAGKNAKPLPPDPAADPAHPLHGRRIVLTGDVAGFTRAELFAALAARGAIVQSSVTKATEVLVIGGVGSVEAGYPLEAGTGKERRAAAYRAAGQPIALLGTDDIRLLLGG